MNVYDDAHNLASSIKNSNEFKEYEALAKEIDANPDLSKMIKDFSEKSMEIQLKQMSGEEITDEMNQSIQSLYAIVMQDPKAASFMQAQMRFSLMMKDIYDIIQEASTPKK